MPKYKRETLQKTRCWIRSEERCREFDERREKLAGGGSGKYQRRAESRQTELGLAI